MPKKKTKTVKSAKRVRKAVSKKVALPRVDSATTGAIAPVNEFHWNTTEYVKLPAPEYTNPIPQEPSQIEKLIEEIDPWTQKYLKFSAIDVAAAVQAQWKRIMKFAEQNPLVFAACFVAGTIGLLALIAALD